MTTTHQGALPVRRSAGYSQNLERMIADLYEVYDLGALRHFEHITEPHRDGSGRTVDVFRLVFADGKQAQLPYAQVKSLLRGFFLGRGYPRGVAIAQQATIRHRPV